MKAFVHVGAVASAFWYCFVFAFDLLPDGNLTLAARAAPETVAAGHVLIMAITFGLMLASAIMAVVDHFSE